MQVVFWHVIDDGKDAVRTLERLLSRYEGTARYCIVKNLGRGYDFSLFDHSETRAHASRLGAAVLELPELHSAAMQKIDRLDTSFWSAMNVARTGPDAFSRMERQRIKVWLNAAYNQNRAPRRPVLSRGRRVSAGAGGAGQRPAFSKPRALGRRLPVVFRNLEALVSPASPRPTATRRTQMPASRPPPSCRRTRTPSRITAGRKTAMRASTNSTIHKYPQTCATAHRSDVSGSRASAVTQRGGRRAGRGHAAH